MRDYGIPEDLPTPDEMWAKLTGTDKIMHKTKQADVEFNLENFQKAVDRAMRQQYRRTDR